MGFGLLDAMGEAEASAEGADREQRPCPSCKYPMPTDAVICMRCGFNQQLGRRMGEARVEGGSAASSAEAAGEPRSLSYASRAASSRGSGGKEWLAGVAPVAVFVLLFLVGRSNPDLTTLCAAPASLFHIGVWIVVLVGAFSESSGQGVLCLCVPCYALYWVYGRNDNLTLRWAYGAAILGTILSQVLNYGAA